MMVSFYVYLFLYYRLFTFSRLIFFFIYFPFRISLLSPAHNLFEP